MARCGWFPIVVESVRTWSFFRKSPARPAQVKDHPDLRGRSAQIRRTVVMG
jgi:hypothetical protein